MSNSENFEDKSGPQLTFPLKWRFAKAETSFEFQTLEELTFFLVEENKFWHSLAEGGGDHLVKYGARQNQEALRPVFRNVAVLDDVNAQADFVSRFFPVSRGPGGILKRIKEKDHELAGLAFTLFYVQQGLNFNVSHPKYAAAQAIRCLLEFVGDPLQAWEALESERQDLAQVRLEGRSALDNFGEFVTRAQDDWSKRLDGYEARAALQAPRIYWDKRHQDHAEKAAKSKRLWQKGTVFVPVGFVVLLLLLFSEYADPFLRLPQSEYVGIVAAFIRLALLGTVGAFAVWWLRQQLRDARLHEHLSEDAAERVTMIETYSALKGGGLDSGDLTSIMTALYRPAATALVDDQGPALPLEILLRGVGDLAKTK
ncbi:hypothetical protein [Falsiroseomonas sp.]|uniref:hypothetical protein n=1 Tax=Falsiroseomonas sp. TaxID=2870721 RepID=UPI003F6F5D4B